MNYYCCIGSSLPPLDPPVAPSANSVSSFLAFEVLQEEKTLLVFLYREFEEDAIQDDSLSNLPKRYFKTLAKVADAFGEGEVGCSMHR